MNKFLLILSLAFNLSGAEVSLTCDAPSETNIVTIRIYTVQEPPNQVKMDNFPLSSRGSMTISNLMSSSKYIFSATFINSFGTESLYSNPLTNFTRPTSPTLRYYTNTLQGAKGIGGPYTNISNQVILADFGTNNAALRSHITWSPPQNSLGQ